jgi:hypothetical protein
MRSLQTWELLHVDRTLGGIPLNWSTTIRLVVVVVLAIVVRQAIMALRHRDDGEQARTERQATALSAVRRWNDGSDARTGCGGPIAIRRPFLSTLIALAATLLVPACSSYIQQQRALVEGSRKARVEDDRLRLMIYTSDITEPYDKLGELSYTDPLDGETIETDHINSKLREMAIARWGQQVDAIIHVTTKVGGTDTTTISVKGEAVRLKRPCLPCRHNTSAPPA